MENVLNLYARHERYQHRELLAQHDLPEPVIATCRACDLSMFVQ